MDRGLYAAGSGGMLQSLRLQIVSNNLANVNTIGFKAERLIARQQEFADTLASLMPDKGGKAAGDQERVPGAVSVGTVTDFSLGPVNSTSNPMHVALRKPNQFFVVESSRGTEYTRAGNFTLDRDGNVVTPDGARVLGEGASLVVREGTPRITSNGTLLVRGQGVGTLQSVGRLRVVEIEDLSQLRRVGNTRFSLQAGKQARVVEADVIPGALEMPNVNIVGSIVEMIALQRSFDAYSKTVRTINELNESAFRANR